MRGLGREGWRRGGSATPEERMGVYIMAAEATTKSHSSNRSCNSKSKNNNSYSYSSSNYSVTGNECDSAREQEN